MRELCFRRYVRGRKPLAIRPQAEPDVRRLAVHHVAWISRDVDFIAILKPTSDGVGTEDPLAYGLT